MAKDPTPSTPSTSPSEPPKSDPTSSGKSTAAPARTSGTKSSTDTKDPLRRSRAGGAYLSIFLLGIVLILLVIFILQNTAKAPVKFLMFETDIPIAVALLVATAAGILLTAIAASMRIVQLRRRVKKDRKA